MKTLRTGIFLLATAGAITAKAQTADDIVKKSIDAIGGKSTIEKVKSVTVQSSVDFGGQDVPTTTTIVFDKGSRTEIDFNGQKVIQCFSDKGGWAVTPAQTGAQALPDEQVKASRAQFETGGPLFNYAAKGSKVTLQGKDTAQGGEYKVQLTTKDSIAMTFYINAKTWLIDKAVSDLTMGGQHVETTAIFSDYRKTDGGYLMPYTQSVVLPQMTLNITNKQIDVNKPVDPTIFDMPK